LRQSSHPPWRNLRAGFYRQDDQARYGVRAISLAGKEVRESADQSGSRSHLENTGIQGVRLPRGKSMNELEFFIDPSRCIGCEACVHACSECDTHRGRSMIHLEFVDRAASPQTGPVVCMHCEDPACAQVCPADAIKQTEDGIVHSSMKSRCIGC